MDPIFVNRPVQKSTDLNKQSKAVPQKVFNIRELFAEISLKADPKASLSALCCSKEIFNSYQGAFNEINEIFNLCLGIKMSNRNSPSATLQQHQLHLDSIRKAVNQRMEKRNMAMNEEVDRLCWRDLPLLKEWITASDKLQLWKRLAESIGVNTPLAENLAEINSCISEADKFSEWFGKNIGQLAGLQKINLQLLQFAALPAEIGQLTGLTHLDLSYNQLAELPTEIGQLTGLKNLDLKNNQLAALPSEIDQLTGLHSLDLYSNQLTALPSEIGQLTGLRELNLSSNQLAELPAEIGQLTGLEWIDLSGNPELRLSNEINQQLMNNGVDVIHD